MSVRNLPRTWVATAALAFAALAALPHVALAQQNPDFTKGEKRPIAATHDWALGATGARGWMYSERMVTTQARQILVTQVLKKSPAARELEIGDVILGIGKTPFEYDPRTEFGRALTAAETKQGNGKLELLRWRKGKTKTVTLKLPVMGTYSATAPFDCEKSALIFEQGCEALAKRMDDPDYSQNPIPRSLNALALLASGKKKYMSIVRKEARWAADYTADSFQTWYYGYACILLAEYILATGDRSVLPGLERLALEAADGQSMVGSWGHRFAQPTGRLAGYGMMNAPGVPLTTGLILARQAGVNDPALDVAIDRSAKLLRFYVGKGAIPYGDHHPWIEAHEDNGKCGMGAVMFDLLGEPVAAEYFARMSVASHGSERDTGHTGNYFNILWAMPAIARLGENATGAWMGEFGSWYFDLARQPNGSFRHLGPPQIKPDSYSGWDATGACLLTYAVPLRSLVLTGKNPSELPQLDVDQAEALIADGRGWDNRDRHSHFAGMSEKELLSSLESWSPVVRERAAMALASRKDVPVKALVKLLKSDSLYAQIGACQAMGEIGNKAKSALPQLRQALQANDLWLRVKAAEAIGAMGQDGMPALPEILHALAREPEASDPRAMEQRYLCFVLFDSREGMLRQSLEGVDQEALYTAIRAGLSNDDGRARSAVSSVYKTMSFEDLKPLLPAIYEATMVSAPSGIMFADGVRTAGLELMAQHRIEEGIEATVHYLRYMKQHGSEKRIHRVLDMLKSYGAHSRSQISRLREIANYFENEETDFPKHLSKQKAEAVREAIREIQKSGDRPKLIQLQESR